MTHEVLIFGPASAAAHADRVRVSLPDSPRVADVLAALQAQHPALAFALAGARLAVNQRVAGPDTLLEPGAEIALISLLGGG